MENKEVKAKVKVELPVGVSQEMVDAWRERYGQDKVFAYGR